MFYANVHNVYKLFRVKGQIFGLMFLKLRLQVIQNVIRPFKNADQKTDFTLQNDAQG